ncbi:MAG: Ig-like domain-containing protein, partial [Actinomycetota bacterium]|nr:Ig-like domain-containing protein [Actinomycetota bacterium]
FVDGHALYNSVFSYYGPFHYEFWGGLSALTGFTFSADSGRWVVWVLWLGTSLLIAITTRRLTGRLMLAVIVQVLSFTVLTAVSNEPMYPGDTVLVLISALVATAVFLLPGHKRIALSVIGALVSAVILTKVNAGGYALIAVGYAALMSLPRLPWGRLLRAGAIAAMVLVGPAVMASSLSSGWVQRYAFLFAASAVALVLVTTRPDPENEAAGGQSERWITWMLSGFAAASVFVIGVILALGTTPGALYESVVTASHQASYFTAALPLDRSVFYWATAGVGVAWLVRRRRLAMVGGPMVGAALRMVAGLTIWFSVVGENPLNIGPENARFALALPLGWVAALPSTRDDGSLTSRFVRLLIPALAVSQTLIAYPVAGSQLAFASVLFLVCGAMCVADGWSELDAAVADQRIRAALWALMSSLTTALAIVFAIQYVVRPAITARGIYNSQRPLPFPGARGLHLPSEQVGVYKSIVTTLRGRCRHLITLPGMLSLNLWSGIPAPSGLTEEPWWADVPPNQLRVALASAKTAQGLCQVRNDFIVSFWNSGRPLPQIPLVRFLADNFRQVTKYGGYSISVRVNAESPPLVTSVMPRTGGTDVMPTPVVWAVFDRPMDHVTTATALSLQQTSDRRAVTGKVVFLGDQRPTFLPSRPLKPGTRYTATISTAATDRVGNHLRQARTWSFTTRR